MPDIAATQEGARKVLPIIYVLDVSGSMQGEPIGSLNQAMAETMPVLQEIERTNVGAHVKIGAVTFGSQVNWVSNGLEDIEDFFWNDVKAAGLTQLGEVLKELNHKMSRSEMFQSDTGFKLPVLIFLSDGAPTDDWEKELTEISSTNKWFKNSTKIAIALGKHADRDVLTKVVDDNPEAVISVDDLETLKKLIRVISATASKIGSVSKLTGGNMAKQIVADVKNNVDVDDDDDSQSGQNATPTDMASASDGSEWLDDDDDDDWN